MYMAIFGLALAVVATACSSTDSEAENSGQAGSSDSELAPTFTVPTSDGGTFSLDEHLASDGRPIFLNLWASWCFPCREEMPAIDAASKLHPEVAFLGVSVRDNRPDAVAFIEEIEVSYPIGYDDENAVDVGYQPLGLPASYIISSEGVIVERIFGIVTVDDLADKFAEHFG